MSTELPSFGQCAVYHCSMHSEEPLSVSKLASSCLLRGKECILLDKKGSEVGVSALLIRPTGEFSLSQNNGSNTIRYRFNMSDLSGGNSAELKTIKYKEYPAQRLLLHAHGHFHCRVLLLSLCASYSFYRGSPNELERITPIPLLKIKKTNKLAHVELNSLQLCLRHPACSQRCYPCSYTGTVTLLLLVPRFLPLSFPLSIMPTHPLQGWWFVGLVSLGAVQLGVIINHIVCHSPFPCSLSHAAC